MIADSRPPRGHTNTRLKAYDGLTAPQYWYCVYRSEGLDKTNAYREAYPNDTSAQLTVSASARNLESDNRIVTKIRDMVAAKMPQTSLVPEIDKNFVLNGIATLAKHAEKENVRLSAFIALAKMPHIGLYEGATDPDDKPKSIVDIDAKLAEYFKLMTTIEGDATRVEPPINENPVKSDGLPGVNPKSVKPEGAGYSPTQVDDSDRPRDRRRKPAS